MSVTEQIRDLFSLLHDGSISAWTGNRNVMTLTVQCPYLAERIDQSFDRFYLELSHIDTLFLKTWPNDGDQEAQTLTDPNELFKAVLELLSADIIDNKVVIACNQHDVAFDYCGGNLTIWCSKIKLFDQGKNELTIEQLRGISQKYWDERREK